MYFRNVVQRIFKLQNCERARRVVLSYELSTFQTEYIIITQPQSLEIELVDALISRLKKITKCSIIKYVSRPTLSQL